MMNGEMTAVMSVEGDGYLTLEEKWPVSAIETALPTSFPVL